MDYQKLANLLYPNVKTSPEEILAKYPPRNLKQGEVVSRFAPSPTGFMHIGNFFQMFISYSLCKVSNGVFFLRMEDTDAKREVEGARAFIYDILNRFGIKVDEYPTLDGKNVGNYGPYVQSQRKELYQIFAKDLVARGKAFPCFCKKTEGKEEILEDRKTKFLENDETEYDPCRDLSYEEVKEHLDRGDKFAIRLRTKNTGKERIVFHDLIKGDIEAKANAKDVILIKNDGIPPYPFAHAVDDTLMGTNVVVRGEEYLGSTPVHLEIFEALGFKPIAYCHNPAVCKIGENGNRRKISKRYDPEAKMLYYFEEGYPKEAVLEYLLNIINSGFEGWRAKNPDAKWEDFKFGINDITAVAPIFDLLKLNDISKNIIAKMSAEEVYENWLAWAKEFKPALADYLEANKDYAIKVCGIDRGGLKPRKDIYKWSMIQEYFSYMLNRPTEKEEIDNIANYKEFLTEYAKGFTLPAEKDEWFAGVKSTAEKLGYATDNKLYKANPEAYKGNTAKACEYIRLALTGKKNSPDIYELMKILGEKETIARLKG